MDNTLPKLELERVFQQDAAEIVSARERSVLIHRTKDIDASGDEVEHAVRRVLRLKLPSMYYVGHGHAVDSKLVTSPQMDLIVADNSGAPILFRASNGTEYFPYESVYAIAEIKSTYYKNKKYVHAFVETLSTFASTLKRERTPSSYIGRGINLGAGLTTNVNTPYRNPLLSFMLFVNSNDFEIEQIAELYKSTAASGLPNFLCFLDKGILLNAKIMAANGEDYALSSINLHPEFNARQKEQNDHWTFLPFGDGENRMGANFAFLYFGLASHLQTCVLKNPDILSYLNRIFKYEGGSIIT